jgi:RsiW-degrading membrane proteinase PrsW (M82 family)
MTIPQLAALILISLIPLVLLIIVWALETYTVAVPRIGFIAVIWGLASLVATNLILEGVYATGVSLVRIRLLDAPLFEELLKAALLYLMSNRFLIRYTGDGTVYGFAVGTGFAIAENALFILGTENAVIGNALIRMVTTGLVHPALGALVGTSVGFLIYRPRWQRILGGILTLFTVIALHSGYNFLTAVTQARGLYIENVLVGFVSLGITVMLVHWTTYHLANQVLQELDSSEYPVETALAERGPAILRQLEQDQEALTREGASALRRYLSTYAHLTVLEEKRDDAFNRPSTIPVLRREIAYLRRYTHRLYRQMPAQERAWLDTHVHP